ncbi:MAG: polysaccharide biosynthesis/export family protein, partial [Acidobacteriota bacterium]
MSEMPPAPTARRAVPDFRTRRLDAVSTAVTAVLLAVLLVGLCGCAARTPIVAPTVDVEPMPPPDPGPYRLRVGDLVAIKFWGNEELDDEQRIRPDGRISMPFIDELQAAGLTPEELDGRLTDAYAGELARPNVTVIVREVSP